MNRHAHHHRSGYTLVEMMVVLAVIGILMASTVPLGSFWIERARLSTVNGEMAHGIGVTIAAAIRNEQALNRTQPAATLCLAANNQLTVLEANATELPDCTAGTGTTIWTSSIPVGVTITDNVNAAFQCLCFNSLGLATTNGCNTCTTASLLNVTLGARQEILHVR